jgi:hypothetical protein
MEISSTYLDKFKPTERKAGEPRSEREAILLHFRNKLNSDRKAAKFPDLSDTRIAKMFEGFTARFGGHLAKAAPNGSHTENHAVNGCENCSFPPVIPPVFSYRNYMFLV